ncbi:TPA: ISAzo13 family transposase, partial [Candidatus Poribacteria bacterium]|nr:ISAzo13 family transposase [Candidatus Poribacteria bacterium]
NWAGIPLRTFETLLGYIRNTTTQTGLRVQATLSRKIYQKKIKISDKQIKTLNLTRRKICPQWNYILKPRAASP